MAHFEYLPETSQTELQRIADILATSGKGLLSMEENMAIIGMRLTAMGGEDTEELRIKYWTVFLEAGTKAVPLVNYLNGIFLSAEALAYKDQDGKRFDEYLKEFGILVGAKFDRGFIELMGSDNETTTQGLDNMHKMCQNSAENGVKFAKWRAIFRIAEFLPSPLAIAENATTIAKFCNICQINSIVPVPHIEIIPFGTYDLEQCQIVAEDILAGIYKAMNDYHIFLEGTLIMMNFIMPGLNYNGNSCSPTEIAEATFKTIQRTVPPAVPAVAFLSGLLLENEASAILNALNQIKKRKPWNLTFGFGRASQESAFKTWLGRKYNFIAAQREFVRRLEVNCKASEGTYV